MTDNLEQVLIEAAHTRELLLELGELKDTDHNRSCTDNGSILAAFRKEHWEDYLEAVYKAHIDVIYIMNSRYIQNRLDELGFETPTDRAPFLEALDRLEDNSTLYNMAYGYLRRQIAAKKVILSDFLGYIEGLNTVDVSEVVK
jgi:hypothetical protein